MTIIRQRFLPLNERIVCPHCRKSFLLDKGLTQGALARLSQEAQRRIEEEAERRMNKERHGIENRVRQEEQERFRLERAELKAMIDDARRDAEALKAAAAQTQRRLDPISPELRGRVLETELENMLRRAFPTDDVKRVGKGKRGADIVHAVKATTGELCDYILWEAKRARQWSPAWIRKLKKDRQDRGAAHAVLITTVFPSKAQQKSYNADGHVWVMPDSPLLLLPLANYLRRMVFESHRLQALGADKRGRAEALYRYVHSSQFREQWQAALEVATNMQDSLQQERGAAEKRWKEREAQIQQVTDYLERLDRELERLSDQQLAEFGRPVAQLQSPKSEAKKTPPRTMVPRNVTPASAAEVLYSLTDVSERMGISMPTLLRYKRDYQGRIPAIGTGRKQRYPERALAVFDQLRTENAARRGRPRKPALEARGLRRARASPRTRPAAPPRS